MGLEERYAVRDQLVDALWRDLVGPRDPAEIIPDSPFSTYVAGVIYPIDTGPVGPGATPDEVDDGDDTSFADPPVSQANTRYPSSMGLTFAVDAHADVRMTIRVGAARYEPIDPEESGWRRIPLTFEAELPRPRADDEVRGEVPLEDGLFLYRHVRAPRDGVSAVTVALVNRRKAVAGRRETASYYQAHIDVEAGGEAVFVERRGDTIGMDDEDLASYLLLYRDVHSFATGHGVSAAWDGDGGDRATAVRTVALPVHEVLTADSNPEIPTDGLGMQFLATGERDAVIASLLDLSDRYRRWIDGPGGLRARVHALPEALRKTAEAHVDTCAATLGRIESGIAALDSDDAAWRAFRLANEAMLRQRARAAWVSAGRPASGPSPDDRHLWRPFQIAFILLNLDGIVDAGHPDREMLDLLWFPTGGGKTEAYLGLIAFTIILRRLRHGDDGAGVTVLMRYTLRLLTIQQFERAAGLVCAVERIRVEEGDLGRERISLALWVGRGGTPSSIPAARAALQRLRAGGAVASGNPMQLRECPWCGAALTHRDYFILKDPDRLVIRCSSGDCAFRGGLPVHVVDSDIYRERPSLVIATADKFATLPWIADGHTLFARDGDGRPPELIVQDELHLISGPLGTLAGLYETAVDLLCTYDGARPKVVASTATIRRARQQARALFDRDMTQFPPPGLDAGDSFFAVTAERSEKAARLYLGAMAPGTSQSTLMIRVYAALLGAIADVPASEDARDPYWTLLGYFNSLRVLGGARIQILDDVRDRLKVIADGGEERRLLRSIELTSREPASEIPSHLERLTRDLGSGEALDYVLATNMISVGMDVDRLGLMVVMGQPQATAEYIQATSRVGRRHPGLIVTLFNAARSRDRSHYEGFNTYHAALYRQVESTSVTPFSPRARDRALHAVLLSLARTMIPELRPSKGANGVRGAEPRLRELIEVVVRRAERVDPGAAESTREELERILQHWMLRSDDAPGLVYANPRDPVNSLLTSADRSQADQFPTPSSLRDVDVETGLRLVRA